MKALLLPACFAAVAAVAGELKDPAEVARLWDHTVDQSRQPVAPMRQTLSAQSELASPAEAPRLLGKPTVEASALPTPYRPGPLYDAPSHPRLRPPPPVVPESVRPRLDRTL